MSDHDPERLERRLIELLADDAAAAEAAFEASELAENAMCREIARKHIDLQRQLDGLGGDERQAIAKAGDEKSTEGKAEQAFRELVERETRGGVPAEDDPTHPAAARRAGPAPARGRLILGWIGAAAAVLLAVVVLRSREPDPNPPLGPGSTELAPTGEVEDFSRFSWTQDCTGCSISKNGCTDHIYHREIIPLKGTHGRLYCNQGCSLSRIGFEKIIGVDQA